MEYEYRNWNHKNAWKSGTRSYWSNHLMLLFISGHSAPFNIVSLAEAILCRESSQTLKVQLANTVIRLKLLYKSTQPTCEIHCELPQSALLPPGYAQSVMHLYQNTRSCWRSSVLAEIDSFTLFEYVFSKLATQVHRGWVEEIRLNSVSWWSILNARNHNN